MVLTAYRLGSTWDPESVTKRTIGTALVQTRPHKLRPDPLTRSSWYSASPALR